MVNTVSSDNYDKFCRERTIANLRALTEKVRAVRMADSPKEVSKTADLSKENLNANERS